MKITVLAVGKLKDQPYRKMEEHYLKLLSRYATSQVVEVKDARLGAKRLEGAEREKAIGEEAGRILEKVSDNSDIVALDAGGKEYSSEEFAKWLEGKTHGGRDLTFIIGGPLGLGKDVLTRSRVRLSLGQMTLPHQMARIVLLEQLYRAWTIIRGETYHY